MLLQTPEFVLAECICKLPLPRNEAHKLTDPATGSTNLKSQLPAPLWTVVMG